MPLVGSSIDMADERISQLEDMSIETSKTGMQREKKRLKKEHNCQELWVNYERCNISIMGIPEKIYR